MDIEGLQERLKNDFDLDLPIKEWLDKEPELHEETLRERILQSAVETYQRKEEVVGAEMMRHFEKGVMLQTLDSLWKEHLAAMDYLRQGIHLRGYAQKDPKQEYKRESFSMFAAMLESLKYEVISTLSKVRCVCRKKSKRWSNSVVKKPSAWRRCSSSAIRAMMRPLPRIWRHKPASVKWGVTIPVRAVPVKNINSATAV